MHGEITALISVIAFGLSYILVNKAQIEGQTSDNGLLPVLVTSATVLILACLVELSLFPVTLHMSPEWRRSILYCISAGLSWNFISRMTLLASIYHIGASRGIVIKSVAPMMTVAMAVVFFGERLHAGNILGLLLMVSSVAFLVMEKAQVKQRSWLPKYVVQGILLGLISALFQSVGHILRKLGAGVVPPLLGATLDLTVATVAYILYLVWTKRLMNHLRFYLHHRNLHVFTASVLSAVGVLTSFVSIASSSISAVSMILGMQPAIMPILSRVCFPGLERFTWVSYLATALAVCGAISIILSGPVRIA